MEKIFYRIVPTALGDFGFAYRGKRVVRSYLPERDRKSLLLRIQKDFSDAAEGGKDAWAESVARAIVDYSKSGDSPELASIDLDWEGAPPFHLRVWRAVRRLKRGKVASYGEVAKALGEPKSARAVGQAMARNKFPPFVPCHRVLAASAKPGGFSAFSGTRLKGRMLNLEGVELGAGWLR